MKLRLNNKLRYSLYAVLAVVFISLTSCDTIEVESEYNKRSWELKKMRMEVESEYNKRSWEIKKMRMELEYLKDLHSYKSELETRQKIADIDSLIQNYR